VELNDMYINIDANNGSGGGGGIKKKTHKPQQTQTELLEKKIKKIKE